MKKIFFVLKYRIDIGHFSTFLEIISSEKQQILIKKLELPQKQEKKYENAAKLKKKLIISKNV